MFFLDFLEDLQQICLPVVVLYNAHVQDFYAKAHLAQLCHGPRLVMDGPLICTILLLVLQSQPHHR